MVRDRIVNFLATSKPLRSSAGWGSYPKLFNVQHVRRRTHTVYPFSRATLTMEEKLGPSGLPVENSLNM